MIISGRPLLRKLTHFTLQWHLTNSCPFSCLHCYDRLERGELDLAKCFQVVTDLKGFCKSYKLIPHISFSGGDPLYYSGFWQLYEHVAQEKIAVSILGNPTSKDVIARLQTIQAPIYYQVSLEGLREHNDSVRGAGHFDQVVQFLLAARQLDLPTHVMLTLTKANLDQIIPLAEELRGLTCGFTFNRLSQVGQGKNLELPSKEEFTTFLQNYLSASKLNPLLRCKDNLFNVIRSRYKRSLYPGCTGSGCGAAYNFLALLPDGQVHACRKFPSLLGNVTVSGVTEIYNSPTARRYRQGVSECSKCHIQRACNGCPAVVFGQGLDPLHDRDPFCFMPQMNAQEQRYAAASSCAQERTAQISKAAEHCHGLHSAARLKHMSLWLEAHRNRSGLTDDHFNAVAGRDGVAQDQMQQNAVAIGTMVMVGKNESANASGSNDK